MGLSLCYDNIDTSAFADGESRQSIIQALQELQKSYFPKGYGFYGDYEEDNGNDYSMTGIMDVENEEWLETDIKFYDPDTRIITLTKFIEEEIEK